MVLSLSLAGCRWDVVQKDDTYDIQMEAAYEVARGFFADNTEPLDRVITCEYSLEELRDYFRETPKAEYDVFNFREDEDRSESGITLEQLDRDLPIECLRFVDMEDHIDFYVVYKVKEGGYYYVFWSETFVSGDHSDNPKPGFRYLVEYSGYFTSLKQESDFDSLEIGVSTAEDAALIDPAMELGHFTSSRTPSYSLLDDGMIMEICYSRDNMVPLKSRKQMVVKSIRVIEKKEADSQLALIRPEDLP
jgi:hypothetical protein